MFQRAAERQQKVHERRTRGKACGIRRNSIKQVGVDRETEGTRDGKTRRERKRKKREGEEREKGGGGKGVVDETSAFVAGRFIINGLVFLISQHGQVEHRVAKNNLRLCVEKATESTEFFEGGKKGKEKRKKKYIYIQSVNTIERKVIYIEINRE